MTQVTYVLHDGSEKELEGKPGNSIMELAVHNNVPGIEAECGGSCACATCHVYVQASDLAKLPDMDDMEDEMLDEAAAERRDNSRLSCQLVLSDDVDSVQVQIPERQI